MQPMQPRNREFNCTTAQLHSQATTQPSNHTTIQLHNHIATQLHNCTTAQLCVRQRYEVHGQTSTDENGKEPIQKFIYLLHVFSSLYNFHVLEIECQRGNQKGRQSKRSVIYCIIRIIFLIQNWFRKDSVAANNRSLAIETPSEASIFISTPTKDPRLVSRGAGCA